MAAAADVHASVAVVADHLVADDRAVVVHVVAGLTDEAEKSRFSGGQATSAAHKLATVM